MPPRIESRLALDNRGYALLMPQHTHNRKEELDLAKVTLERSRSRNRYLVHCHALDCEKGLTYDQRKLCSRCRRGVYCSEECQKAHWKLHKSSGFCESQARQTNGTEERALAIPTLSNILDAMERFKLAWSYELDAAVYSSLQLLSNSPLHKTHVLALLLTYDPNNPDPSLVLRVRDGGPITFADVEHRFTPGVPGGWSGNTLPPTMTVRALSAHAALVPAHDNWPGTTSPTLPITVVMLAEQFDSSGTVVASCTLMQAMWQPDLRHRLQQVHPSIVIAYSDKDFMTSFKKRSELSDWKMVPGTEPPMTEREVARFKGWW